MSLMNFRTNKKTQTKTNQRYQRERERVADAIDGVEQLRPKCEQINVVLVKWFGCDIISSDANQQ